MAILLVITASVVVIFVSGLLAWMKLFTYINKEGNL